MIIKRMSPRLAVGRAVGLVVSARGFYPLLVIGMLALAGAACTMFSAESLNNGQGTRENPVPARVYAKTTSYNVRALSLVWQQEDATAQSVEKEIQTSRVRLQVQIQCQRRADEICELENIGRQIKLVDVNGVLYEPILAETIDNPLQGEILGEAEKTGWLAYEIPSGISIASAVAEYGESMRVFFKVP